MGLTRGCGPFKPRRDLMQTFQAVYFVQYERFRYINVSGRFWAFLVMKKVQKFEKTDGKFSI